MDFIKALSIIGRDLEEAMAMLDQLSATQVSGNAEIELARSRVRTASELLRLLPGLNGANVTRQVEAVEDEVAGPAMAKGGLGYVKPATEPGKYEEAAIKAPEMHVNQEPAMQAAEMHTDPEPAMQAAGMHKTTEPEVNTSLKDEAQDLEGRPVNPSKTREPVKPQQPPRSPETARSQDSPKSILADRFQPAGTIGEKISSTKADESIKSVMHSKPIADIAEAIGMNDKFYFIRELFSGNSIAYNETIGRLNASSSLGEAMKILDESTVMGSDPAAQSSFVDVVRRKFNLNV